MSLSSALQLGANALLAQQVGLQVVGNNIANASNPTFIRQEVQFSPAPAHHDGDVLVGLGVRVEAVKQKVDKFLETRLRDAIGELANSAAQERAYAQLERIVGELTDTDLSTSLTDFYASINDILNQPDSLSVRNLAALHGKTLSENVQRVAQRVFQQRLDIDTQVLNIGADINGLTTKIAKLNIEIVSLEGAGMRASDAVGLRDERYAALRELSDIIDIQAPEQPDRSVSVFVGGEYLVFGGFRREVDAILHNHGEFDGYEIRFVETDSPLTTGSGRLSGLIASRDEVVTGFLTQLNDFAETLIVEFNKIYSSGQGLSGYDSVTSTFQVDSPFAPLDASGLEFVPVNGSFQVLLHDKLSDLTRTTDVRVQLNGLSDDTTLVSLSAALNAIDGISSSISVDGNLTLTADTSNLEFAFANDTAGALAALGINTFFTGSTAFDIAVNSDVATDPSKFAASRGGIGSDTDNALQMAGFPDRQLESRQGETIVDVYEQIQGGIAHQAAVARSVTESFRIFEQTLQGERLAVSGVNIDEEAVRLISLQRSFQATARYISTVSDLLAVLMNL